MFKIVKTPAVSPVGELITGNNEELLLREYRKNFGDKWLYKVNEEKRSRIYLKHLKDHIKNRNKERLNSRSKYIEVLPLDTKA